MIVIIAEESMKGHELAVKSLDIEPTHVNSADSGALPWTKSWDSIWVGQELSAILYAWEEKWIQVKSKICM